MKVFDRSGMYNFVDDNNVFVGFDSQSNCCENFGWFLTRNPLTTSDDTENHLPDNAAEGFNFDPAYFSEWSDTSWGYEGNCAVFRLVKGEERMFLTIYNHHNGYYSHGFEMAVGGEVVRSGVL